MHSRLAGESKRMDEHLLNNKQLLKERCLSAVAILYIVIFFTNSPQKKCATQKCPTFIDFCEMGARSIVIYPPEVTIPILKPKKTGRPITRRFTACSTMLRQGYRKLGQAASGRGWGLRLARWWVVPLVIWPGVGYTLMSVSKWPIYGDDSRFHRRGRSETVPRNLIPPTSPAQPRPALISANFCGLCRGREF